jgi:hypothetical protein
MESMLPMVGVFVHCKIVVGYWVITPSCVWLRAIEVLVIGRQDHCVRILDVVPIL